ncbi:MAG: hypothetical protein ACYTFT_04505 [Planctomycetota bacterium]
MKQLVRTASERNLRLEELGMEELRAVSPLIEDDVFHALSVEAAVAARQAPMGTSPERVREALTAARARFAAAAEGEGGA